MDGSKEDNVGRISVCLKDRTEENMEEKTESKPFIPLNQIESECTAESSTHLANVPLSHW